MRRTRGGAISDRYAAAPTPSGTATTIAIAAVASEPYTNSSDPYTPSFGFQSELVRMRNSPTRASAGHAWYTRMATSDAATHRTNSPAV